MSVADWVVNVTVFSGLLRLLTGESYFKKLSETSHLAAKHVTIDIVFATLLISIHQTMGTAGVMLMAALLLMVRYGSQAYYELRSSYEEVQVMLISILDARDSYTAGHSARVADNAVKLAGELKLAPHDIENLRRAGLLHDIGKVNVPDSVLKKPGKLSKEETEQMNQHPVDGARFVDSVSSLKHLTPIIRHHHERLDGQGYPDGLTGEDIPLGARILLVADAFDAMTTDRPYRRALPRAEALRRIVENAGTQFDRRVAWAAVRVFGTELPEYTELRALQQWVEREVAASRQDGPPEGKA
ncbi:MAG: HD-GYP domain-containing protein [Symbiobacteriia bacterium]